MKDNNDITLEECLFKYKNENKALLINDGKIVGFCQRFQSLLSVRDVRRCQNE